MERVVVLRVYAVHACSFNDKSDYSGYIMERSYFLTITVYACLDSRRNPHITHKKFSLHIHIFSWLGLGVNKQQYITQSH